MPRFCKTCTKIASESKLIPPPKIKQASFNIPNNPPKFCKEHADKETMVDMKNSPCEFKGCPKQPHFNDYGQIRGRRCADHKLDNMVDVVTKKCELCVNDPKYIPTDTNPEPKVPTALYGGKFCIDHREDGMKQRQQKCKYPDCTTGALFNIIDKPPKYCSEHGKLVLGNDCIDVVTKRCKHGKIAKNCAELDCMGNNICFICCQRNRRNECIYTYKPDPFKDDIKTTTLCSACYRMVKLSDELVGKTSAQAMKILKGKTYGKMKEARVLKSIIETFSDKTWREQSHVPLCDMKLTKKRYFTDLELDIGAIYQMIFENDENQHKSIACEFPRMNDIVAANGGRHLVFVRFNPDRFVHENKPFQGMFNIENEPTEVYTNRMPEVIKIVDQEIQRVAFLEQTTHSIERTKDSLIRIVFINYDDNSSAIADAVKMVGEKQVAVYHTC